MWDSNSINYQGKLCNHVKLYYKHLRCLINISIPQLKFLGFFSLSIILFYQYICFYISFSFFSVMYSSKLQSNWSLEKGFLQLLACACFFSLCKKYFPLPQCLLDKLFQEGMNHICLLIPKRSHRCCKRNTNPTKKMWSPLVFSQWNVLVVASLISVIKDES